MIATVTFATITITTITITTTIATITIIIRRNATHCILPYAMVMCVFVCVCLCVYAAFVYLRKTV